MFVTPVACPGLFCSARFCSASGGGGVRRRCKNHNPAFFSTDGSTRKKSSSAAKNSGAFSGLAVRAFDDPVGAVEASSRKIGCHKIVTSAASQTAASSRKPLLTGSEKNGKNAVKNGAFSTRSSNARSAQARKRCRIFARRLRARLGKRACAY
jgi:hypothetical protein